ncbi:MAG: hypothetical protein WC551_05885 [Patescibacteria group bacterium]
MKILFAVTYVSSTVSTVPYVSEDGENFKATTEHWAKVSEPKRFVKGGQVGTQQGKVDGCLDEWFLAKGVYEFWTESREVANAVAATINLARDLFASRRFDGDLPL